jgi:hypothetical protein
VSNFLGQSKAGKIIFEERSAIPFTAVRSKFLNIRMRNAL